MQRRSVILSDKDPEAARARQKESSDVAGIIAGTYMREHLPGFARVSSLITCWNTTDRGSLSLYALDEFCRRWPFVFAN